MSGIPTGRYSRPMDKNLARAMKTGPKGGRYYESGSRKVYRELSQREQRQASEKPSTTLARGQAEELHEKALMDGGFTYDVVQGVYPTTGFVVSVNPEHEESMKGNVSVEDLQRYAEQHSAAFKDPEAKMGAWYDSEKDRWYVDVVHVVDSKERAVSLARDHNQEGIFDLSSRETIITKPEAERRN